MVAPTIAAHARNRRAPEFGRTSRGDQARSSLWHLERRDVFRSVVLHHVPASSDRLDLWNRGARHRSLFLSYVEPDAAGVSLLHGMGAAARLPAGSTQALRQHASGSRETSRDAWSLGWSSRLFAGRGRNSRRYFFESKDVSIAGSRRCVGLDITVEQTHAATSISARAESGSDGTGPGKPMGSPFFAKASDRRRFVSLAQAPHERSHAGGRTFG